MTNWRLAAQNRRYQTAARRCAAARGALRHCPRWGGHLRLRPARSRCTNADHRKRLLGLPVRRLHRGRCGPPRARGDGGRRTADAALWLRAARGSISKLACGSGITVLVEPVAAGDPAVASLLHGHSLRRPVLWASDGSARSAVAGGNAPAFAWDGARYAKLFEPASRLVLIGEDGTAFAAAAMVRASGDGKWALVAPGGPDQPPFHGIAYHRIAAPEALGRDRHRLLDGHRRAFPTTARMTSARWRQRWYRMRFMSARSAQGRGLMRGWRSCAVTG